MVIKYSFTGRASMIRFYEGWEASRNQSGAPNERTETHQRHQSLETLRSYRLCNVHCHDSNRW